MYQDSCMFKLVWKSFQFTLTTHLGAFCDPLTPQELHDLVAGRKDMEMEKETLVERVEASKRVIEAGRRESLFLEKQVKELERRLQWSHGETHAAEEKLQTFLKKVASLLQVKCETVVMPTEQDVLHKVENLCNKVRNLDIQKDVAGYFIHVLCRKRPQFSRVLSKKMTKISCLPAL